MALPHSKADREYKKFVECPEDSGKPAVRTKICQDSDESLRVRNLTDDNELLGKLDDLIGAILLSRTAKNQIVDGIGTGLKNKINKFNALKVYSQEIPDIDDPTILVPKSGFLTDENGNSDARVNGSASPIDFTINALEDTDLYISGLSFRIADQNAQLSKFGNIPPLPNGLQLIYKNQDIGERILLDELKSNFDLVRACQGNPPFNEVEAFRATNIIGNSEGYLPVLKIKEVFNLPFGIRLKRGTLDKLILRVNDNVSAVDAFDIFYYATEFLNT